MWHQAAPSLEVDSGLLFVALVASSSRVRAYTVLCGWRAACGSARGSTGAERKQHCDFLSKHLFISV